MKDDTLQSNCHHNIGYTTNKWPPAWIIWWITAQASPSGSYFCLLKNSADWKQVEILHPFLISLPFQVEPKFYFLLARKDEFPCGYCLPDCPDVSLAVGGDDFEKQLHSSIDAKRGSCSNWSNKREKQSALKQVVFATVFRSDAGKGVAALGAMCRFLWASNWTAKIILQAQKCNRELSVDTPWDKVRHKTSSQILHFFWASQNLFPSGYCTLEGTNHS